MSDEAGYRPVCTERRKIGDTPSDGVSALTRPLTGARAEPLAFFLFFLITAFDCVPCVAVIICIHGP
ncbi:hypothetical protein, partial [Komagataeibacter europaeus]|uniref:hypothetical protein n=1 Tax=Komagataeibacter europaeus TaxID=33995 RepID=UPI00222E2E33